MSDTLGDLLREWRKVRRLSQMDLALEADISPRHLSFIENGRSRASYDLILRLAEVLQLAHRDTNALLTVAGYAPRYSHWSLNDDQSGMIRHALQHILSHHNPYPSLVVNRAYDAVMVNEGFQHLATWLGLNLDNQASPNLYRMMFDPQGLRPYIRHCDQLQTLLLKRLYHESIASQDARLLALHAELSQHAPPMLPKAQELETHMPIIPLSLYKGGRELSFFSTLTTFGTPIDITVQELRIESLFPADAQTQSFFE